MDQQIDRPKADGGINSFLACEIAEAHFDFARRANRERLLQNDTTDQQSAEGQKPVMTATALVGYIDANFRIRAGERLGVLKISGTDVSESEIAYRSALLSHLEANVGPVPIPRQISLVSGRSYERCPLAGGRFVRMLTYLPGRPLADVNPQTPALAGQLGDALAGIDRALLSFTHPSMNRYVDWDLSNFLDHRSKFDAVASDLPDDVRNLVDDSFRWFSAYSESTAAGKKDVRKSVIHGDANDYNVLFDGYDGVDPRLSAIIDFGDSTHSELINESAIALAYLMMGKSDPLTDAAAYVSAYCEVLPLTELEISCLLPLVKCRLSTTVVSAATKQRVDPGNDYYQVSAVPARSLLLELGSLSATFVEAVFRDAAGFEPYARAARLRELISSAEVKPMLDVAFGDLFVDVVDLSAGSNDGAVIQADSAVVKSGGPLGRQSDVFCPGSAVKIGRYDEARVAYRTDTYAVATEAGTERRTVHLGIDVFGSPGTAIRTPIAGEVYGVADNNSDLDYGPTVVLRHELANETFFSLFGHLSRECISKLKPGDRLSAGSAFARLGSEDENGGWVPHLHYQLMLDMLGEVSSFPGVARPSQRRVFASLCPDPNLLLRIPDNVFPQADRKADDIAESRRRVLGPSLSLSYRTPLHIVRGQGTWLLSADGQRYLDCVNNVCHVGHCHPRVVDAIVRQARILNTNTRYLHQTIVDYAEALTDLLPDPLNVCFFVCSGSEANDLALRLSRAYTGRNGVVALESGYHGHLTSLVDVSSYKFAGPGGKGAPPHVELASIPDSYRARSSSSATSFAASVASACARLEEKGYPPAAFIAETILSCGGQVEPPEGYLQLAYAHARNAGALCIADEVQTGFGRMGSHFWAFETQGVVPDIVTMGKPIGNGHPIAAVVTTRAVADAFNNGMEYFNTYGGNPVSCAAAQAVLDVIKTEELQKNALAVGDFFLEQLTELQGRFRIIGDVRGRGLFLGVELVRDRETLEPADVEASYLVNRMQARGVLLSTDGPLHNVIKIKPPMVFTRADVGRVVAGISSVLEEDFMMGIGH